MFSKESCVALSRFQQPDTDRKSTRLNSSHLVISYAVFCLKKKTIRCLRHRGRGQYLRGRTAACTSGTPCTGGGVSLSCRGPAIPPSFRSAPARGPPPPCLR